jgi:hypothetical protein
MRNWSMIILVLILKTTMTVIIPVISMINDGI